MHKNIGTEINISDAAYVNSLIPKLRRIRDLTYFDGPLLTEFVSATGDTWFMSWFDTDCTTANRWLLFTVEKELFSDYMAEKVTIRSLIRKTSVIFILDIDNRVETKRLQVAKFTDLPKDCIPSVKSFHSNSFMPEPEDSCYYVPESNDYIDVITFK